MEAEFPEVGREKKEGEGTLRPVQPCDTGDLSEWSFGSRNKGVPSTLLKTKARTWVLMQQMLVQPAECLCSISQDPRGNPSWWLPSPLTMERTRPILQVVNLKLQDLGSVSHFFGSL